MFWAPVTIFYYSVTPSHFAFPSLVAMDERPKRLASIMSLVSIGLNSKLRRNVRIGPNYQATLLHHTHQQHATTTSHPKPATRRPQKYANREPPQAREHDKAHKMSDADIANQLALATAHKLTRIAHEDDAAHDARCRAHTWCEDLTEDDVRSAGFSAKERQPPPKKKKRGGGGASSILGSDRLAAADVPSLGSTSTEQPPLPPPHGDAYEPARPKPKPKQKKRHKDSELGLATPSCCDCEGCAREPCGRCPPCRASKNDCWAQRCVEGVLSDEVDQCDGRTLQKMRSLRAFVVSCGGTVRMLTGWWAHSRPRPGGAHAGELETRFVDPAGSRHRSMREVVRTLGLEDSDVYRRYRSVGSKLTKLPDDEGGGSRAGAGSSTRKRPLEQSSGSGRKGAAPRGKRAQKRR